MTESGRTSLLRPTLAITIAALLLACCGRSDDSRIDYDEIWGESTTMKECEEVAELMVERGWPYVLDPECVRRARPSVEEMTGETCDPFHVARVVRISPRTGERMHCDGATHRWID